MTFPRSLNRISSVAALLALGWALMATDARAQGCSIKTQGYSGGCDNIYIRWLDTRRDATSYLIVYADGYRVTVPGSKTDYGRNGVGCGWGGQISITGNYANGSSCTTSFSGSLPHNRQCGAACAAITQPTQITNGANFRYNVSPGAIAAAFGEGFTPTTAAAAALPLPQLLAGVRVFFGPAQTPCELFYVSPTQINFLVPPDAPLGLQSVAITNAAGVTFRGDVFLSEHAPAVFTRDGTGNGVAAAALIPAGEVVYAVLFLTGVQTTKIRAADCYLLVNGGRFTPSWIGAAPGFVGLVQVNVPLPKGTAGGAMFGVHGWTSQGFELR